MWWYPFYNYANICKIRCRIGSSMTVKTSWVGGNISCQYWSWHICILTEERKNPDINHRKVKWKFANSPNRPAFLFVYILMHLRGEWVLVWFGSQHKRVEQPVPSTFPEFPSLDLSISCNYVIKWISKVHQ